MSHSFNNILIHAIWSTKDRQHLINFDIEKRIYQFMKQQFTDMGCFVLNINGMPDHIHCLFLLNPTKTINDVIKQVKGSSSHYINQQNLISQKFSWQTGYAAYSVSQSIKGKVFDYIQNQKSHHKKISSQKEMDEFLELHGLKNG
jgi:REP element-mobilizing transposase RayT